MTDDMKPKYDFSEGVRGPPLVTMKLRKPVQKFFEQNKHILYVAVNKETEEMEFVWWNEEQEQYHDLEDSALSSKHWYFFNIKDLK